VAAVCPAAAWAGCTKPQSDRKENEGRSEKSGRPFLFLGRCREPCMEQVKGEKQNRTIHKRRVAGKAPRAVGLLGGDRFPALPGWAKLCRSYGAGEQLRGHGRDVLETSGLPDTSVETQEARKTRATLNRRALREIGAPFLFFARVQIAT
jgi:hypothetical protein